MAGPDQAGREDPHHARRVAARARPGAPGRPDRRSRNGKAAARHDLVHAGPHRRTSPARQPLPMGTPGRRRRGAPRPALTRAPDRARRTRLPRPLPRPARRPHRTAQHPGRDHLPGRRRHRLGRGPYERGTTAGPYAKPGPPACGDRSRRPGRRGTKPDGPDPKSSPSSAGPVVNRVKRTVMPSPAGEQQNGPAEAAASGASGASRTVRQGPPSQRARTVTASPARLARTVTCRPAQSGTGAMDQSDRPSVTTAPSCGDPSLTSSPALIQCSASTPRSAPPGTHSSA